MTKSDQSVATTGEWRKSTHSGAQSNCVEIAPASTSGTGVRDSKNPAVGHLVVSAASWAALTAGLAG